MIDTIRFIKSSCLLCFNSLFPVMFLDFTYKPFRNVTFAH